MRVEDLRGVKVGDTLICPKHNAKFEVCEIDTVEQDVPIKVKHIEGGLSLTSDYQTFAEDPVQWLYANPEDFMETPEPGMITLEDLEPFNPRNSRNLPVNSKPANFKMTPASEIVKLCKERLMEAVEKRILTALAENVVWSVEIKDLDINPIKDELKELGYDVDVFANCTVVGWGEE